VGPYPEKRPPSLLSLLEKRHISFWNPQRQKKDEERWEAQRRGTEETAPLGKKKEKLKSSPPDRAAALTKRGKRRGGTRYGHEASPRRGGELPDERGRGEGEKRDPKGRLKREGNMQV